MWVKDRAEAGRGEAAIPGLRDFLPPVTNSMAEKCPGGAIPVLML